MDMKVHCPGCTRPLRVPKTSSGRKARCPNCSRVFIVPQPHELVDETISTWIEEDLQKLGVEAEKHWESIGSIKAYQRPAAAQAPPPASLPKGPVGTRIIPQAQRPHTNPPAAAKPATGAKPAAEVNQDNNGTRSTVIAVEDLTPIDPSVAAAIEVQPTAAPAKDPAKPTMPAAPRIIVPPPPAVQNARGTAAPDQPALQYPTSLRVDPHHPHLVVAQTDQAGVTFAFDSVHLEHIGFRTSMPVRCAFSGENERRKLSARPFAFIDRSGARIRSPQEIESKRTTTLLSGQSTRDLLDVMGNIDQLPKPYSLCMPYYATTDFSHVSLRCWTETRGDGGVTCFVVIPNGPTALQWLGNVNGACGAEYEMLEKDIGLLENEAWRQLGDECRRRLAVWCPFEPMEHFRVYLSDGDFGTRDKGLAGIVLTDRRLIYCKYHHRGSIDLAQPATLKIRDETDFAQLTIENADGRTKLVKLHLHDVPVLISALSYLPTISVDRKAAAAPAPAAG